MIRLSCWIGSMQGEHGAARANGEIALPMEPFETALAREKGHGANQGESGERCQCVFANVADRLAGHFARESRRGHWH